MKKNRIGQKRVRRTPAELAEASAARESLAAYRMAKAATEEPSSPAFDVDGVIRLIREAKREGVAFFEGPGGIKFGFKRDVARLIQQSAATDDFIP